MVLNTNLKLALALDRPAQIILERVMGIEPTSSAWKAEVLPLNYTRSCCLPEAKFSKINLR
jgi:hypothetical protein